MHNQGIKKLLENRSINRGVFTAVLKRCKKGDAILLQDFCYKKDGRILTAENGILFLVE